MISPNPPPQSAAQPGCRDSRWQVPLVCLVLAAITFAVFGQTLTHEFINFDDNAYVYENPVVARGLTIEGFIWAFAGVHAFNWHPLTWLSHMLDCQMYGLNPGGHHLTNVLLHTATVVLLFLVLRQMTGALWRSAFVAAVFAIHPLRVESVAWVAERKDVLSGLFFILTIGAYVRYARLPWSAARYVLLMVLFALGLLCKPMLVTLPLVLLLLDYWPLRRMEIQTFSRLLLEKAPLLALSAASCVVTLLAQHEGIESAGSFSMPYRLANTFASCAVYLRQMVWPVGLAVYYPFPVNGLPPWEAALAGTLLIALSMATMWQRRKQPWLLTGWFWYLTALSPVAGVVQAGDQAHADRYTYLPQIGIYVALTWWAAESCAKWRVSPMALGSLMTGVLMVLMVCTWKQTTYWKNSETLWIHTLSCTTANAVAQNNLGDALDQLGMVDEAIPHLETALRIKPDYAEAHYNLGTALLQKGMADEALDHFQKALQINPDYTEAHNNLGFVFYQKGRTDEAIAEYQKALQINPDLADAQDNLGVALFQKGRIDEAITHFQRALQMKPGFAVAHDNLGTALFQKGNVAEAITHFQKALQINPAYADANNKLAMAFLQNGNAAEAIVQYQNVLQLEPADPGAQINLAWLLATAPEALLRNGTKALELAQQANTETGGENPIVLHILAAAFAEAGRFSEAMETAQRALNLAAANSNMRLASQLQYEMNLYQAGSPFHNPDKTR
jgi:protein O-mannosyl-transferase